MSQQTDQEASNIEAYFSPAVPDDLEDVLCDPITTTIMQTPVFFNGRTYDKETLKQNEWKDPFSPDVVVLNPNSLAVNISADGMIEKFLSAQIDKYLNETKATEDPLAKLLRMVELMRRVKGRTDRSCCLNASRQLVALLNETFTDHVCVQAPQLEQDDQRALLEFVVDRADTKDSYREYREKMEQNAAGLQCKDAPLLLRLMRNPNTRSLWRCFTDEELLAKLDIADNIDQLVALQDSAEFGKRLSCDLCVDQIMSLCLLAEPLNLLNARTIREALPFSSFVMALYKITSYLHRLPLSNVDDVAIAEAGHVPRGHHTEHTEAITRFYSSLVIVEDERLAALLRDPGVSLANRMIVLEGRSLAEENKRLKAELEETKLKLATKQRQLSDTRTTALLNSLLPCAATVRFCSRATHDSLTVITTMWGTTMKCMPVVDADQSQEWTLDSCTSRNGRRAVLIWHPQSGKALDNNYGVDKNGNQVIVYHRGYRNANQQFQIINRGGGTVVVRHLATNKYLTVCDTDGTKVVLWESLADSLRQEWTITPFA